MDSLYTFPAPVLIYRFFYKPKLGLGLARDYPSLTLRTSPNSPCLSFPSFLRKLQYLLYRRPLYRWATPEYFISKVASGTAGHRYFPAGKFFDPDSAPSCLRLWNTKRISTTPECILFIKELLSSYQKLEEKQQANKRLQEKIKPLWAVSFSIK